MKGSFWEIATLSLAGLSLLLVIVNAVLVVRNQSIQVDVNERQQVINQGLQFARLRQAIAQLLGNVAISKQDHDISELLARHGISVNAGPAPSAAPAAPQGK
ncbi:MAG TPA: hypothetical protein VKV32_11825 [Stellaceae bacterium]|nr:hypothetical protein [Stellaceae bacterium]